ncbi:MAG: hypothetical protein LBL96_10575 [Clostridiales bacterium]|jgi:hypothetical protein|nr:hypothetical protein [Clostridiales bacterium]
MISHEIYSKLKQTDISKGRQKSKERAKEVWKAMSKEVRDEVCKRALITKSTVDRACRLGSISAKIVTAFADIAGVDPRWLTGRSDEKKAITDAEIEDFLSEVGYKALILAVHSDNPTSSANPDDLQSDALDAASHPKPILDIARTQISALSDEQNTSLESMNTEDMEFLIKCLNLRARFNEDARSLLGMLKLILIA